jgi:enediyne biosynthesis protein E4
MMKRLFCLSTVVIFLLSCKGKPSDAVFELLESSETGIDFINSVKNSEDFNIFNYRNFYNGAGVAVGDINNDGLPDVLFTANMGSNKLYLNKGNKAGESFKFEDITTKAGVAETDKWNTGVVMVDINNDGWLDIYICNAGIDKWKKKQGNTLFINNHDLTFTERAAEYGLDDKGYSTHAAFLDYDLDGDLDCYILNNSFIPVNTLNYDNNRDLRAEDWPVKDFLKGGGDKLLKNENGKFVDVSKEAGIYGSLIGFGLGVTVGDVNNDNYPDIYISNDFFEKDYLYINQKNGKFSEELESRIGHTSLASMGADMGDINNDGNQEIYVTDMLPRDELRLKTTTSFDNNYVYKLKHDKGFYNQYMQNSLHLNNADGTFSEIANYANVAASDWSWGALLFDADNDSKTDIYVSNGIFHDVIDQDFIDFFANEVNQKMVLSGEREKFDNIIKHMPSRPIVNNFFHNDGDLKFSEKAEDFGFTQPSFSNGAAYADLDNDGDLDLLVNNVNQQCFVYRNNSEKKVNTNNFLKLKLEGSEKNTFAIGAKIFVHIKDEVLVRQINPSKGFQSSTEYLQTIGLGQSAKVDSVVVFWPNNTHSIYKNQKVNTLLKCSINDGRPNTSMEKTNIVTKKFVIDESMAILPHVENEYDDFYEEKNIPMMLSKEGPNATTADVNGDGSLDLFVGGAKNQVGRLYVQNNGKLILKPNPEFDNAAFFEDTSVEFFDADGDGDQDLFVGTGGNESNQEERLYINRLYLNDGKGNFSFNNKAIPFNGMNTSCVAPHDYDNDGDIDLFVGNRSQPKKYGLIPPQQILENNGKGIFKNVTKVIAREIEYAGMARKAIWEDVDGDKIKELILVGDWMNPKVYRIRNKAFTEIKTGLENYRGFWGALRSEDIDNDGDKDLILGNIGENFALKTSENEPLKLWVGDFDDNQLLDKIFTKTFEGKDVPVFLKREMMEQFPKLKAQNLKHSEYAKRSIEDLFDRNQMKKSQQTEVNTLKSVIAINDGKGNFTVRELPANAQISCINAIETLDLNHDGFKDMVLAGNFVGFIPQFTRLDACRGVVLLNNKKGGFVSQRNIDTGFVTEGEVRDMKFMKFGEKSYLISFANNRKPQFFEITQTKK